MLFRMFLILIVVYGKGHREKRNVARRPSYLRHHCMFSNYITEIQIIIKDDFEKGNGLATCYLLSFSWNCIILITSCKDNT